MADSAPRIRHEPSPQTVSGVLVSIGGTGVLITGESGVGKSQLALELLDRGHQLVADDVVELRPGKAETLLGSSPPALRGRLEVRGLGIIRVRDLFGPLSQRDSCPVDMLLGLIPMSAQAWADWPRLEAPWRTERLLERNISRLDLPIAPDRPLCLLAETAARLWRAGGQR
ncbi:MAG: hypothetical protein JJU06_21650 [Ectothiorhodospiraceae bacterium]|nr:hypothetical protein [Ectothiorhodospiraceae bacterium]MCH8504407.1 hypothetical protein [Ectothiorhodospiraceae bacterium]